MDGLRNVCDVGAFLSVKPIRHRVSFSFGISLVNGCRGAVHVRPQSLMWVPMTGKTVTTRTFVGLSYCLPTTMHTKAVGSPSSQETRLNQLLKE